MSRIAGDSGEYEFRLMRNTSMGLVPTDKGFGLVSVTTFLKETLPIPPSAMSYHGLRIGLKGVVAALAEDPQVILDAETPELLEAALKERGVSPNMSLESAGSRGTAAHNVLELMASGERQLAEEGAAVELDQQGTQYGHAAIKFWDEMVQPFIDSGEILQVLSEVPVWSLKHGYCGTLDLAIEWAEVDAGVQLPRGWEVLDAKTHKPARGFTLDGKGAGYISDAVQCRAYRMAFEEMGMGSTIGNRTIVLRENGKYLTDQREVSPEFVLYLRKLYDQRMQFEKGA